MPGYSTEIKEAKKRYIRKTFWLHQLLLLSKIQDDVNYNRAAAQAQVALFQEKVKRLLDQIGVYNDLHHQYLAYALALDKTQATMGYMVDLIREHQILRQRFEKRNLDPTVLDQIDSLVIYRTADS